MAAAPLSDLGPIGASVSPSADLTQFFQTQAAKLVGRK